MGKKSDETRKRILDGSRKLFNEKGFTNISIRDVAKDLGMSHGNLCYHYPNTDELAKALYYELVAVFEAQISNMSTDTIDLQQLTELTSKTLERQFEYRFLMIEFVAIIRRIPEIHSHYTSIQTRRKKQFEFILQALEKQQYLKPAVGGFSALIETFILVGNFWISEALLLKRHQAATSHYASLFGQLLAPYMTEKGLKSLQPM